MADLRRMAARASSYLSRAVNQRYEPEHRGPAWLASFALTMGLALLLTNQFAFQAEAQWELDQRNLPEVARISKPLPPLTMQSPRQSPLHSPGHTSDNSFNIESQSPSVP